MLTANQSRDQKCQRTIRWLRPVDLRVLCRLSCENYLTTNRNYVSDFTYKMPACRFSCTPIWTQRLVATTGTPLRSETSRRAPGSWWTSSVTWTRSPTHHGCRTSMWVHTQHRRWILRDGPCDCFTFGKRMRWSSYWSAQIAVLRAFGNARKMCKMHIETERLWREFGLQIRNIPAQASPACTAATLDGEGFTLTAENWTCADGFVLDVGPPRERCLFSESLVWTLEHCAINFSKNLKNALWVTQGCGSGFIAQTCQVEASFVTIRIFVWQTVVKTKARRPCRAHRWSRRQRRRALSATTPCPAWKRCPKSSKRAPSARKLLCTRVSHECLRFSLLIEESHRPTFCHWIHFQSDGVSLRVCRYVLEHRGREIGVLPDIWRPAFGARKRHQHVVRRLHDARRTEVRAFPKRECRGSKKMFCVLSFHSSSLRVGFSGGQADHF